MEPGNKMPVASVSINSPIHSLQPDPKHPFITIQGEDGDEWVILHRDGSCTIPDESKLDVAARSFVVAMAKAIKLEFPLPEPYVVRVAGVSEFISLRCGCEEWVQDPQEATHFVRKLDAERAGCAPNPNVEVVLLSQAMVF